MIESDKCMDFNNLVYSIQQVHDNLALQASRAVNISLTLRNWGIGFYIQEYEHKGSDRAKYGEALLDKLAEQLRNTGMKRVATRELRRYRKFYQVYPDIVGPTERNIENIFRHPTSVLNTPFRDSLTPELTTSGKTLVTHLSFTHLAELISIEDSSKRTFYQNECIRGNWSVRELKRQIASLYFERSHFSENSGKLAEMVHANTEKSPSHLEIRDPYIFEFLGIKSKEVMSESDLEYALLDKLQDFLLELGHGFCFEARQKRILIGDSYGFVDLVFYHRILKCHVLIDLKIDHFTHGNIGQLNTYVSWYQRNMKSEGDNRPIGILLCTKKDDALVEYALAGMDNGLFVSRYKLELPSKEDMQRFLSTNIGRITGK